MAPSGTDADAHEDEVPDARPDEDRWTDDPQAGPPARIDAEALAARLRPLANPVRIRLLDLLTTPRYVEELAARLGMTRQGVRKHLDLLLGLEVVVRQEGRRETGPVTEYVLNRPRIFQLHTEFARLGRLRPEKGSPDRPTIETPTSTTAGDVRVGTTPVLSVVRGLDEARSFPLSEQAGRVWRIGRAPEAEVRVDYDPFVSNRHAEVRRTDKGFVLVDAFSRNGSYRNWERLERGQETPLAPGDIIGIGKTLMVFRVRESDQGDHPPSVRSDRS